MDDVSPKRAARARIVSRLPVSPDARDLFVGREAELGRLVRALDRAIAHEGRLVLLVGEFLSKNYNVILDTKCTFSGQTAHDIVGSDPMLAPVADR